MDKRKNNHQVTIKLTVYFEDPFWVGVLERVEGEMLSVCKITFGAEPRDYEVAAFLREHYYKLRFSPGITVESKAAEHKNPKRVQRAARRETLKQGVGTKSQQAMKLLQEENKRARKVRSREEKIAEDERLWEMKRVRKKEKKRGR